MSNVGLKPFSRKPLFREHIMATKDMPRKLTRMLDPTKIRFYVDSGQLENASQELLKQLAGKKFGSGNYWRYLANGPEGLAIAKAYRNLQSMKLIEKAEAAERKLMKSEDAFSKAYSVALAKAAKAQEKEEAKALKAAQKAAKEKKKREDQRKRPLVQRVQAAAKRARNVNLLTVAQTRQLQALLQKMEGPES